MVLGADAESATKVLPHLAAFAAVMEAGSFAAAARRQGIDKTLMSRRITTLERHLGVRLLQRSTRSISPTEAGRRLYEQTRGPLDDMLAALLAAGDAQRVEGSVRIATFAAAGLDLWGGVVAKLRVEHPGLTLDLRAADPYADLVDQGIDLALRSGHMPDSALIARRIGSWRYVLCAAPQWLATRTAPMRHPRDIDSDWILFAGVTRADQWHFKSRDEGYDLRVHAVATVDSFAVQQQLVLAGAGIAALPAIAVREPLASGRMMRVLPHWGLDHSHGLWVVLPSRQYTPPRVEAVVDALVQRVHDLQPQWDEVAAPIDGGEA